MTIRLQSAEEDIISEVDHFGTCSCYLPVLVANEVIDNLGIRDYDAQLTGAEYYEENEQWVEIAVTK